MIESSAGMTEKIRQVFDRGRIFALTSFYNIKPLIPRCLQIAIRRNLIRKKLRACSGIWPIDQRSDKRPENWEGWPGGKKFALILTHDVETQKGQERCYQLIELEKRMGFRSSFGFVAERYPVSSKLRYHLEKNGFEVMVHGLYHDGKYFRSLKIFQKRAALINHYLREWRAVGFRSPSMHHKLEWIHDLNIAYDSSTFDTDPFEPQPDGVRAIFPFYVRENRGDKGYVELPYTLPQDFTLFVLMGESDIGIWKQKLDWITEKGGMALFISHPDYMSFDVKKNTLWEYPARYYEDFLQYIRVHYGGTYWNPLPRDIAQFWVSKYRPKR